MAWTAATILCGALLVVAGALKATDRRGALVALETYGLGGRRAAPAWAGLVAIELSLGLALAAGVAAAAWAAAALLAAFSAAHGVLLLAGRGGAPCGCLGGRGRVSPGSAARAGALSVACAVLALQAPAAVAAGTRGLGVLLALAAGGAAVAAWRRARPRGALEIAGEGPAVGAVTPLVEWLPDHDGRLRLAVFTSPSCGLCRALAPALERLAADDRVVLRTFEEERDAEAWRAGGVPGAPFAVAVGPGGIVLAKGTVNGGAQLESVLAAAERRAAAAGDAVGTSRRAFLGQAAGAAATAAAAPTVGALVAPGEAGAHHFCGHIYTTDSCPHPTGLPRIDSRGLPLRARDGRPVDDLGRPVDGHGRPLDARGRLLRDAEGDPLAPAPRTPVCDLVAERFGFRTWVDGAWYRCCGGRVRKLVDCCSHSRRRINGDRSLKGYCYRGRRVFCVLYLQTKVPC